MTSQKAVYGILLMSLLVSACAGFYNGRTGSNTEETQGRSDVTTTTTMPSGVDSQGGITSDGQLPHREDKPSSY